MVHKKYITRNGKTYGPYLYESYRENGKVKKRYIKAPLDKKSSRVTGFLLIFSLIIAIGFLSVGNFTGNSILDVGNVYSTDGFLDGVLTIDLKSGEFLPADSVLGIVFSNSNYEFILSDIISNSPTNV